MIIDVAAECFNIIFSSVLLFCGVFIGVGVLTGLFQTIFNIQDQAIPMALKAVALLIILTLSGDALFQRFSLVFAMF